MIQNSFNERFAFLRRHADEHAAHTARLSKLITTIEREKGKNYVFMSGATDPLHWGNNDRRFYVVHADTRRRSLRIAYMTGWRDGIAAGLLAGVLAGLLIACTLMAVGAYGSIEGLRWLL